MGGYTPDSRTAPNGKLELQWVSAAQACVRLLRLLANSKVLAVEKTT